MGDSAEQDLVGQSATKQTLIGKMQGRWIKEGKESIRERVVFATTPEGPWN